MIWRKVSSKRSGNRTFREEFNQSNKITVRKDDEFASARIEFNMTKDVEVTTWSGFSMGYFTMNRDEAIAAARAILKHFGED